MAAEVPNDEWMKALDKELGLQGFNEDIRKRREYHNILLFADKVLLSDSQQSSVEQLGRLFAYPFANVVYGARALDMVRPKGERDSPSFRLALAGDILLKDLLRRDWTLSATDNYFYSSEHQLCFDNSRFAEVYDALGLRPLVSRIEAKDLGVHSKGTILEAVLYTIYLDARDRFDSETTAMLCLRAVMRTAGIYPRFKSVPFTTVLECDREFRAELTKLKNFTKALCWYQYDIKEGREDQTEAEALQGMTPIPVPTKLRWKKASRKKKACTGARKVFGGVFDRPPMTPKPLKRRLVNKPMTKKEMSKDIVKDRVERITSKLLDRVRGGRIEKRKNTVDAGEDAVKENGQGRKTNNGKMTNEERATQAEAKKQLEKVSWLVVTPRRGKKAVAWIKLPVSGKGEDVSSAEMKEELRQHIPNPTTAQKGRDITNSVGEGASGATTSIFGPNSWVQYL